MDDSNLIQLRGVRAHMTRKRGGRRGRGLTDYIPGPKDALAAYGAYHTAKNIKNAANYIMGDKPPPPKWSDNLNPQATTLKDTSANFLKGSLNSLLGTRMPLKPHTTQGAYSNNGALDVTNPEPTIKKNHKGFNSTSDPTHLGLLDKKVVHKVSDIPGVNLAHKVNDTMNGLTGQDAINSGLSLGSMNKKDRAKFIDTYTTAAATTKDLHDLSHRSPEGKKVLDKLGAASVRKATAENLKKQAKDKVKRVGKVIKDKTRSVASKIKNKASSTIGKIKSLFKKGKGRSRRSSCGQCFKTANQAACVRCFKRKRTKRL